MEFQDPVAGEPPLQELAGIQFGILSKEEILKFSVFEGAHVIDKPKDIWDNRLGVHNLRGNDNHCGTCGASKASECDGHFGHVNLPLAIYHPLHIRHLKSLLSRICLVCHRFQGQKEVKKCTFDDEATWTEMKRQIETSGSSDQSDCEISEHLQQVKISTNSKCVGGVGDGLNSSESSVIEEGCKYCGANFIKRDERYPNLVVTLSKESSYETIEMKAVGKGGVIPTDYWRFVHGHPAGESQSIRLLLPFEALNILKSLSEKVIRQLGMDERLARPESFILNHLPLPPCGSRIVEVDFGSSLPRAQMDGQQMHLQRLASESKRFRNSLTGKLTFEGFANGIKELQSIASDYLTNSKWEHGVKLKRFNAVKKDVDKADKLMKGQVLAKLNDASARMVVVGDPSIKLEEILLPLFLVEHLTVPVKVTSFNINSLQQIVDNGPHANLLRAGAVYLEKPGTGRMRLGYKLGRNTQVELGNTVHRHLRNGDLVIVNRPPSLAKYSFMAMRVRLHSGCSLSINPLVCPSFQADFDGDCMHIFVPQSFEALAEVHGLMTVSDQLINSQGGQSNNVLDEDSRLGAYLISSSCLFLDKIEMSQLTSSLPIPAILKSPKLNEPLWTGQQLFSTILPKGVCYRATDEYSRTDVQKGIFINDGELLVCNGKSDWLGDAPDALTAVISKSQGPAAAVMYLNRAQDLANEYVRDRGFSVGLYDFQLTGNRSHLFRRRLEEVARANREALMQTLLADEHVQREELKQNPTSNRGILIGTKCHKSKGLYLGTTGIVKRVEALDKIAIDRFQTRFGQITSRLVMDFCKNVNPLLVMVNAGKKISKSKLNQQTISLGLQLYKGEHLIPWSAEDLFCQKESTGVSSLKAIDLLQFEKGSPLVNLPGYWESRGIITSSYLDGLSSLQFFTHNIASRYGLSREKVWQPNVLLKRLLLFLRDLHVGYDGSVRSLEGQQIVQFEYGGLLEMEESRGASKPEKIVPDCHEAGDPVGILAATAVTAPLYQLKLDSPHMIGAKAMGPLELIDETLSSGKVIKLVDRRVLLRMPLPLRNRRHGQEKGSTRIQEHLKPVALDMVASTTMIEYRKTQIEADESGRKSPWVGHIRLNAEKLKAHQLLVGDVLKCLENNYSMCTFATSDGCHVGSSSASQEDQRPCIHFFTDFPSRVAALDDNEYEAISFNLLEAMKGTIIPILLRTTIKGDERIESLSIFWEEMNWNPRCAKNAFSKNSCKNGRGELVVEVTVKGKYCKVRGKAWEIVEMACLPIMQLLDWQRCMPYSIKEINHIFGLEAAKGVMLQRLELAVEWMGKGVNSEHLELIADSMLISGEVNGASMTSYKDLCKTLSWSTPFSNAAFQNPKNSFLQAGRQGAYQTTDGALSSTVWGKAPSLGTGSNFGIFWQPAKVVEEPLHAVQTGVDIHQRLAKLNYLIPPKSRKPVPFCATKRPQSRSPAAGSKVLTHRRKDSFPYVEDKVPSQPATTGRSEGMLGDGRNINPSQPTRAGTKDILGDGRNVKPHQSTQAGTKDILGDGRSMKISDLLKGIKHSHHVHQRSRKRDERAKSDGLDQVGNQSYASDPVTSPDSVGSPWADGHEDSSSFNTSNARQDQAHSENSSPCSNVRKGLYPPPLSSDIFASEGGQMSGIPPLKTPISQVVRPESCASRQLACRNDALKLPDAVRSGSVLPIAERSRNEGSKYHLNHTIRTQRVHASEDALERRKEEHKIDWEKLMLLYKDVQHILHRKYAASERIDYEDQKFILEKLLRYHPDCAHKIGCGVKSVKVDHHENFSNTRCFFVVRLDETVCDFSFHKCIKGYANAQSPALAMQYDHEVLFKYERYKDCSDVDLPYSPDLILLDSPEVDLPNAHEQLSSDLIPPAEPVGGDCNGSNGSGSMHKEESSCETSELKPELQGAQHMSPVSDPANEGHPLHISPKTGKYCE